MSKKTITGKAKVESLPDELVVKDNAPEESHVAREKQSKLKALAKGFRPDHLAYRLSAGLIGTPSRSIVTKALLGNGRVSKWIEKDRQRQANSNGLLGDFISSLKGRGAEPFPADLTPKQHAYNAVPLEIGVCVYAFALTISIGFMAAAWGSMQFLYSSLFGVFILISYFQATYKVYQSYVCLRKWDQRHDLYTTKREFIAELFRSPSLFVPIFFNVRAFRRLKL